MPTPLSRPARRRCWRARLADVRLRPGLLFGARTAAAAMLALLVAFTLRLDQPGWAATSAVIVAQPILGATLRKGMLRLFGTLVGACAGVLLFVLFPQDRVAFLLGLAVWGGLCSAAATLLGDLLSYAPLLAGYTCAIVAMSAVAQPPDVLLMAVARGAAIAIGIVSTSLVFSLTSWGQQRSRLAGSIETASREAMSGLLAALGGDDPDLEAGQAARRTLLVRVAALDGLIDQAVGENLDLGSRVGVLRRAVAGLLVILSSWRGVEQHRRRSTAIDGAVRAAGQSLRDALAEAGDAPERLEAAAHRLEQGTAADPSARLLLDRVAHGLSGLAAARTGLRLLVAPLASTPRQGVRPTRWQNPFSAAVNGLRSLVTVALACAIWVVTGWEQGPTFVIFAMVVVVLFGTREEMAFSTAAAMAASCGIAFILAAILKFVVMPLAQGRGLDGFGSLCLILGVPLTVLGTVATLLPQGRPASGLAFMTFANLMPLLSPSNEITYDLAGFLNGGMAIVAGATLGAAAHRLWPPLPRDVRTRLLLRAARGDLRRIASGAWRPTSEAWEVRQYGRIVGLPPGTSILDHARLLAALSVGRELLRREARGDRDEQRRRASEAEIAEAVASHPEFFRGLGLTTATAG